MCVQQLVPAYFHNAFKVLLRRVTSPPLLFIKKFKCFANPCYVFRCFNGNPKGVSLTKQTMARFHLFDKLLDTLRGLRIHIVMIRKVLPKTHNGKHIKAAESLKHIVFDK